MATTGILNSQVARVFGATIQENLKTYLIFMERYIHIIYIFVCKFKIDIVPIGPSGKKWALILINPWGQTGSEPLPEPLMTKSTDECMHHQGLFSVPYLQ